jgi:hypothetical protein
MRNAAFRANIGYILRFVMRFFAEAVIDGGGGNLAGKAFMRQSEQGKAVWAARYRQSDP